MIEVQKEENQKQKALLVGLPEVDLYELEGLCKTLEIEVAKSLNLSKFEQSATYGIGSGKAQELAELAKALQADCIIFDFILEPRKQRNWEKLCNLLVFDRQEVILKIFSKRAKTKEANLQVQLANLEYSLPRLAHIYGEFSRQRGGNYGSKGSGETQLELDRRQIRNKIAFLKKEIKQVALERKTQKKRRKKTPCPSCAIIGYTNAGKSTLLNALTGGNVFAEDKLFATLDPTTRRMNLKEGSSILLTDTVGFISNLPHSLVSAFKSTLEEAADADLQILVLDASDPNIFEQYKTVIEVLTQIGANDVKQIIVLNKIDSVDFSSLHAIKINTEFESAIRISALKKTGFEDLKQKICDSLLGRERQLELPIEKRFLIEDIRKNGVILSEDWLEDKIKIKAHLGLEDENQKTNRLLVLLKPYLID
ncbi:GTPase HflX [Treponema pectinovorum]|uniref:GTPase HflX n=1 Tax=Treponema pectinovorum TaxID=164 RepID=UPI003D931E4D